MLKWKLPFVALDESKLIGQAEPAPWPIDWLKIYDDELKACKSQIDAPYAENRRQFDTYTIQMEPSSQIKSEINRIAGPQLVTNAWLKLIELIIEFRLTDRRTGSGQPFRLFDNASAPGAFIMAMNYWTSTMEQMDFDWTASSLISTTDNTALGDSYGLARLYPHKFATYGTKYDGNTFDTSYLRYIEDSKYAGAFDLYTSDLGMFVPEDRYNCQEAYNARGNLGQVLMGLLVLRPGGAFVTKQFANMSSFTLSIMASLSSVFDELYVAKPITSKPDNSETYLIGKGYRGSPKWLINILFDAVGGQWDEYDLLDREFAPPLLPFSVIPPSFISATERMTKALVIRQCVKISENLAEYRRMVDSGDTVPSSKFIASHVTEKFHAWLRLADFKRMSESAYIKTSKVDYSAGRPAAKKAAWGKRK